MKNIVFFLLLILIVGCETTGDPRQGGLFGWNEDKAQERQQRLRGTLGEEDLVGRREKVDSQELENIRGARLQEEERLRTDLAAVDSNLNRIQKQIANTKTRTAQQQREKQEAQQSLARLKAKKLQIQQSSISIDQKKERVRILNQEIENLLQLVSNL